MAGIEKILSESDRAEIAAAIAGAESRTTAVISVRFEKRSGRDPMRNARASFTALGMRNNPDKNSVMFYISVTDRKFAVLGDDGINSKVGMEFWDSVRDAVIQQLKQKQFSLALCGGIGIVGEKLAEFFPAEKTEKARADSITFGQ
ncbi:MAG: TPM domain-containing protein [Spirochaetia bacterium]|nr:TPM domain-containing protein [Spirochaetia bacterium]